MQDRPLLKSQVRDILIFTTSLDFLREFLSGTNLHLEFRAHEHVQAILHGFGIEAINFHSKREEFTEIGTRTEIVSKSTPFSRIEKFLHLISEITRTQLLN